MNCKHGRLILTKQVDRQEGSGWTPYRKNAERCFQKEKWRQYDLPETKLIDCPILTSTVSNPSWVHVAPPENKVINRGLPKREKDDQLHTEKLGQRFQALQRLLGSMVEENEAVHCPLCIQCQKHSKECSVDQINCCEWEMAKVNKLTTCSLPWENAIKPAQQFP